MNNLIKTCTMTCRFSEVHDLVNSQAFQMNLSVNRNQQFTFYQSNSLNFSISLFHRSFMIVQPSGLFVHQRQYPKMVLISSEIKGDNLVLTAPGKSPISVKKQATLEKKNIKRYE